MENPSRGWREGVRYCAIMDDRTVLGAGLAGLFFLQPGFLVGIIAGRCRRRMIMHWLSRSGRIRCIHRFVERGIESRFLALGIALEPLRDRCILSGLLARMGEHQSKKTPTLRALHAWPDAGD